MERKQTRTRKERTPEEQITALHKLVQRLVILAAALATSLALALGVLVYMITGVADVQPQAAPMSRNYTTSATTDGP